jgi:hypothetical protein
VSDSQEPSYYEIALTNRQVLYAFVILLVCILAAFIAGVWVGRGDAVSVAPQQAATDAESPADEEGDLERLSFFGDDGAAGGEEAVEAQPAAGTTLRDDLEGGRTARPEPPPATRPQPAAPAPAQHPGKRL